jgi:DNA/RNA-binding domain of Phe-tRNA-synthetase-like protein
LVYHKINKKTLVLPLVFSIFAKRNACFLTKTILKLDIEISNELAAAVPNLGFGIVDAPVHVVPHNAALWAEMEAKAEALAHDLAVGDISALPNVAAARAAYKAVGKEPSRYRLSAEALLRRITTGKGLYQINNVVDIINFVSFSTGFSIGGYDADKVQGRVAFGLGQEGEPYEAIGRGPFNIHNLPVFRDALGAFGSPTSDSPRTCITDSTQRLLMVIIDFGGQPQSLLGAVSLAERLLADYGRRG